MIAVLGKLRQHAEIKRVCCPQRKEQDQMKTTLFMMMAVSTVLAACAATAGERMSPNTMIKQMTPSVRSSAATTFEDTHGVAQESNELRCRGGDGIRFVTVEGRTNSSGEATSYVVVYFHEAAQASGLSGRSLQPGQCAFPQRALRTDEPLEMVQEMVSFGQTRQQLHGTPVDTSPTAAERFPDA
ncbi:MAG: hypothetical protein ABJA62_03055, partial [Luteimonas sp.]